jgi:hypothetical protein
MRIRQIAGATAVAAALVVATIGLQAPGAGAAKPPWVEFGSGKVKTPKNPAVRAGRGHEFVLRVRFGPFNPATFPNGQAGGIGRPFTPGVPLTSLDGHVSVEYFLKPGVTCGFGVPRVTLRVDEDGNGILEDTDGAAFGYLGDPPGFNTCPSGQWVTQDLTADDASAGHWDLRQFGGDASNTWEQMEALIGTKIVMGADVLMDSSWTGAIAGTGKGRAFFDNVVLGDRKFRR